MANASAELFERRGFKWMFKGPVAQASVPGHRKVWACGQVWAAPALCQALPALPGPKADDPRRGLCHPSVLVYVFVLSRLRVPVLAGAQGHTWFGLVRACWGGMSCGV